MKLISLFDSQKEAGKAIETLSTDKFAGVETHVIEEIPTNDTAPAEEGTTIVTPQLATMGAQTAVPPVGPVAGPDLFDDLDLSRAEERFVKKGVQDGGVAVIVSLDDSSAAEVEEVLNRHGGKVFEE